MNLTSLFQLFKEVIGEAVYVQAHFWNMGSVINRNPCRLLNISQVSTAESTAKHATPIGRMRMRAHLFIIPNFNAKFLNLTSVVLRRRPLSLPSDISGTQ